jgi:hypothetical protein
MQGIKKWSKLFTILTACLIMMGFIVLNFYAMERNEFKEYKTFALTIAKTVWDFDARKQGDNLYDFMSVMTKVSMIRYMALYVGHNEKAALDYGTPVEHNWRWPRTVQPESVEAGPQIILTAKEKDCFSTLIALPGFPANGSEPKYMAIVFSMSEFQHKERNIMLAVGSIATLLLIIVTLYNILGNIYQRLKYAEQKRSDVVYKITHNADKYLTWIQCALDLHPESYFQRNPQLEGRELVELRGNRNGRLDGTRLKVAIVH